MFASRSYIQGFLSSGSTSFPLKCIYDATAKGQSSSRIEYLDCFPAFAVVRILLDTSAVIFSTDLSPLIFSSQFNSSPLFLLY